MESMSIQPTPPLFGHDHGLMAGVVMVPGSFPRSIGKMAVLYVTRSNDTSETWREVPVPICSFLFFSPFKLVSVFAGLLAWTAIRRPGNRYDGFHLLVVGRVLVWGNLTNERRAGNRSVSRQRVVQRPYRTWAGKGILAKHPTTVWVYCRRIEVLLENWSFLSCRQAESIR
jgi:hypothetical protein